MLAPVVAVAASRGLWAPDEPRYAEVAREIYDSSSFVVMHLCGEVYPDKPPLLFWLAGLLGRLFAWSPFAMRLVSLAATAGTALLVARLARRWWGEREERLAPALFLGTVMVTEIGGRLQIDPLLAFLTTAALAAIDAPARDARHAGRLALAAGLAVGLAALAKGPVAFAIVGLVLVAWRLTGARALGETGGAREPAARAPLAAVAGGVLLCVLPVAVWAAAAIAIEPSLKHDLLFGQHLERALEGQSHAAPIWKPALRLPQLLLPWTGAVAFGLAAAWRAWRATRAAARATTSAGALGDAGLVRAGAWLAVLFLFFSAITEKRDLYLLPAYPAAALLAARWLALEMRAERGARVAGWLAAVPLLLVGLALIGAPLAARNELEEIGLADGAWRLVVPGLVLLVGGNAAARAVARGDARTWVRHALATWSLGIAAACALLLPALDAQKSPRELARWLAERPERPSAIPCLGVRPEGYRFYGDGDVPTVAIDAEELLRAALAREGADFLALVRSDELEELDPDVRARTRVLGDTWRVGSRRIAVLGARGASHPHTGQ